MELNDVITPSLLLVVGGLGYVIKYVIPKIQLRIDELETHKAAALTKDQMTDILDTNNKLMKEMFKNLVLELELKLKD